ncbi:hypothetical protein [Streptomyces sp. NPDC088925]|uniref:hypothetical protein n=1 Tax=Streptomyces sp. NPDC088925 TaxID=3365914 RepID=UPI0038026414
MSARSGGDERGQSAAAAEPEAGTEREPSADAVADAAPEAWESVEQLFEHPHLRHLRGNVMAEARFGGDAVAGDKWDVRVEAAPARTRAVGPLPPAELREVEATFVAQRAYDELYTELTERRVLVLRGRAATGRRTAALRMLTQARKADAEVVALDPGAAPEELAPQLRPGGTYLLVDPVTTPESPLREVHLHAARHRLGAEGLLVVVTGPATVTEDVTARDWQAPPAVALAKAHVRHALARATQAQAAEGTAPGTGEADEETIAGLFALPATVDYLATGPSPGETSGFALLLVRYARGLIGEEELRGYGRDAAERLAGQWFGAGRGSESGHDGPGRQEVTLRDKAFLLSLAVLDGLPYPLVAELGDRLCARWYAIEAPARTEGLPVFGTAPGERLALARADEYESETRTPWGLLPERVVAFRDGALWSAVLAHVWYSHPAVRDPFVDWLGELVQDGRVVVRLRAAVASGVLLAADFAYGVPRWLGGWASSARAGERQLAAWALYAAAEHGAAPAVRRLLREWSGQHHAGLRWTVARCYAVLGGSVPLGALRDLGWMAANGPEPDGPLRMALEQAVESLLQGPAATVVLNRLAEWHEAGGRLRELATAGFLRALRHRHKDGAGGTWPRLLRLPYAEPAALVPLARLWRTVLNSPATRGQGLAELNAWVRSAESTVDAESTPVGAGESAAREEALAALLPLLAGTANERERLRHLLGKLDRQSRQDSHGSAAGRLLAALDKAARDTALLGTAAVAVPPAPARRTGEPPAFP